MAEMNRRAKAEELESMITQRFIAGMRLWQEQNIRGRLGDFGTLKIDCADLLITALTKAVQMERERCAKLAWEIGVPTNQQKALSYGKGKRYQWERDHYRALVGLACEIAAAIRTTPQNESQS